MKQKKGKKILKVRLFIPKSLSTREDLLENTQFLELEYEHHVKIEQILKDSNIKTDFLGIILLDGKKKVSRQHLIQQSCELNFFLLMAGG